MSNLLDQIKNVLIKGDRVNLRDRRGHYASGNLTCLRDQYWSWHKEPETNPSDFTGAMKMMIGSAIEDGIIKAALSKLAKAGYFLEGTQVPTGGSSPNWDGYFDALMSDAQGNKFVIEIKTKSGYGADLFKAKPEPDKSYMTQLGLYLKDAHEKGITNKGLFLYVLLSDNTFGDIVLVNVEYDPKTVTASATHWINSRGDQGELCVSVDLKVALERWNVLNKHIETKEVPKPEYQYKYPLTYETVREIPDAKLKKIIEGTVMWGDWQPLYSRYKNKGLAADGISPQRTEDEIKICLTEYRRRHPRTKL